MKAKSKINRMSIGTPTFEEGELVQAGNGQVILCCGQGAGQDLFCGVQLTEIGSSIIGGYSTHWIKERFNVFNGSIELENDDAG